MRAATMRVRKQIQQRQQQEDDAMSNHLMADLDGISDDDEDNDIKNPSLSSLSDYNHQRLPSVYNVVEENIPMLLVDGRISNYEDDDNDKQENNAKHISSTQH